MFAWLLVLTLAQEPAATPPPPYTDKEAAALFTANLRMVLSNGPPVRVDADRMTPAQRAIWSELLLWSVEHWVEHQPNPAEEQRKYVEMRRRDAGAPPAEPARATQPADEEVEAMASRPPTSTTPRAWRLPPINPFRIEPLPPLVPYFIPPNAAYTPVPLPGYSQTLWLQDVIAQGHTLRLSDGSVWSVNDLDVIRSSLWIALQRVTVAATGVPGEARLVNTTNGQTIRAQQLR